MKEIDLLIYSTSARQTGKTELLRRGVDNYDKPFFLVCSKIEMGKHITKNPNCIYVTPQSMDRLKGHKLPVIFDQEWLLELMKDYSRLQYLQTHNT